MMTHLQHFFHMGGYAFYIWLAYSLMIILLGGQGLLAWKKWKNTQKKVEKL